MFVVELAGTTRSGALGQVCSPKLSTDLQLVSLASSADSSKVRVRVASAVHACPWKTLFNAYTACKSVNSPGNEQNVSLIVGHCQLNSGQCTSSKKKHSGMGIGTRNQNQKQQF